jgi:23S rRNA (uracil747-C5)-methyltransferase
MDCHWFKTNHCHSCELLDRSYTETILLKEKKLKELFSAQDLFFKETIGLSEKVEKSRNKAKFAIFGDSTGIQFGFYDSHLNFKKLEECPLHMEGLNDLLPVLKTKLKEFNIIPYSLADKKGELKYVILSKSQSHNDLLIRFVLRSKESLDRLKKMATLLVIEFPFIKVVTANLQPEHKAVMEGDEEIVLTKENKILHQFDDVFLTLGPRSFFQVTPEIAGKLYASAGHVIEKYNVKSFLDLFCGVGAFSYFAAKSCPDVLGVELSKEAIVCAQSSQSLNKISGRIAFEALDVEAFLKSLDKNFEAILVNPPRRGLNKSIIKDILAQKPKLIIYSSCNAETLLRDFSDMNHEYKIVSTQIFDMFPYTEHFETLMLMLRTDA